MYPDLLCQLLSAVKSEDLESLRSTVQQYRNAGICARSDLGHGLCIAANCGSKILVKELIKLKADVLYADEGGRRPIHYACLGGSLDVLRHIVRGGSPISVQDGAGCSALHYAVEQQNHELVAFLVREGATIVKSKSYANDETPLHLAAQIGDEESVRLIVGRCVNANSVTLDKHTPLMYAVKNRHIGVVRVLCESRVDLEKRSASGDTALHMASDTYSHIVRALLEYGANPSCSNLRGEAPLHIVAFRQPKMDSGLLMASLLLERNANLNAQDNNGYTPLHSAALSGNVKVAGLLLDHGALVNVPETLTGNSALITAVVNCRKDVIELLVNRGADVNFCNTGLMSPLHTLQGTRNAEKHKLTDLLLRHGAKVNKASQQGYTPLDRCVFHSALGSFSLDTLVRLVQAGAYLKPVPGPRSNIQHNSPLCWLTWRGNLPAARFLVDSGWELARERWIRLPGKTQETAEFLAYIWSLTGQPNTLRVICRTVIREYLNEVSQDTDIVPLVEALPIPNFLKRFINLQMEVDACKAEIESEG